jgi:hypothetical protein
MDLGKGLGHLTYSTLVHPADDWEQIWQSLNTYVPKVKERFAGNQRFGVSLRLSAKSAETLVNSKAERDKLRKFLDDQNMYLYTVNAFVYGHFKGELVKEQVYEPDWRSEERTRYTMNVASVVADIAPADVMPSIQTSPLGFKPRVTGPDVVQSYTDNVLRVTKHLIELEAKTGVPIAEAIAALRKHVGIVYDICHLAVEYEDITQSLQKLVDAGVPIVKLQEAAALHMPEVTQQVVDTLKRYSKTIYLTQTIEKRDGKLTKYLNLEDAFAAWEKSPGPREWRTHIHVPVFLDDLGQFRTTRFAIADALKFHKQKPLSRHLEVETYTWDMLPDSLKTGDIVEYVCRELDWVRGQLT